MNLKKMFVIVRKDIPKIHQAVQGGHALAEYLLKESSSWTNGTLIYLGVKGLNQLENLKNRFETEGIPHREFREPDMGNQITSIATDVENRYIKKLNLLA